MSKKSQNKKAVETKETVITKDYDKELNQFDSMSAKIRFLNSKGETTGNISKILTKHEGKLVRYQWVRNVLITPVSKPKA